MEIGKVFVIGAGTMGSGIAQVIAGSGYEVYLSDIKEEIVEKAKTEIEKSLERSVQKGNLTGEEKTVVLKRLRGCTDFRNVEDCDLVIEAASENIEVKKSIFHSISEYCRDDAILASNTSSISITRLATEFRNPNRFIGMHFFNPATTMKLIEMISGLATSEETRRTVKAFGKSIGKVVVEVKDGPGFLVNRTLSLLCNEAVELLDQGYGSIEDIDEALVYGCGHPMGPLTLIDLIGVDIVLAVMEEMYRELSDSKYRPALLLKKMVRSGYLGIKTGEGFYVYDKDGSKKPNQKLL